MNGVVYVTGNLTFRTTTGSGYFTGSFEKTGAGRLLMHTGSGAFGHITLTEGELGYFGGSPDAATGYALNGGSIGSTSNIGRTIGGATTIGGNLGIGTLAGGTGLMTFGNTIDLTGGTRTLTVGSGGATFSGIVSNGGITKLGDGILTLSGAGANTYAGLTTVSAGQLAIHKDNARQAISGDLWIDGTGKVLLTGGRSNRIVDSANITLDGAGTVLELQRNLSESIGLLTVNGGTVNLLNRTQLGFAENSGQVLNLRSTGITASDGAVFNIGEAGATGGTASLMFLGAGAGFKGSGTVAINAGSSVAQVHLNGATRTFNITGGTTTIAPTIVGDAGNGLVKTGAGTLALTGANTYGGGTTVSGGTLRVDNTTGSGTGAGAVTVASGATLGGIGTLSGATTIAGIHAAGNSAGKQTFGSDLGYTGTSVFEWELSSNITTGRGINFDAVDVGGNLTVDAGAVFTILLGTDFNPLDSFWTGTRTWNVFSVDGAKTDLFQSFALYNISAPGTPVDYSSYGTFSYGYVGDSGTLTWSAVPEPASAALMGVVLGVGLLHRRRV